MSTSSPLLKKSFISKEGGDWVTKKDFPLFSTPQNTNRWQTFWILHPSWKWMKLQNLCPSNATANLALEFCWSKVKKLTRSVFHICSSQFHLCHLTPNLVHCARCSPLSGDDGDGLRVGDSRHDQEGGRDEPGQPDGRVGRDVTGDAHHSPLDEHSEPGGHHAVDHEVDAGVCDEKEVGDSLRVEDVGGGVVRPLVLHAVDRWVHGDHGQHCQDGPEMFRYISTVVLKVWLFFSLSPSQYRQLSELFKTEILNFYILWNGWNISFVSRLPSFQYFFFI